MPLYRLDREGTAEPNGSIPVYTDWIGGPSIAAVRNCPVAGTDLRRSARVTGQPDTWFSVPAFVTVKGKRVVGYLTGADTNDNGELQGYEFRVMTSHEHLVR